MNDYEKKQIEQCRKHWFKNHVAEFQTFCHQPGHQQAPADNIEVLRWHEPGTGIYGVRYVKHGRMLLVYGDIGEAAFCWSTKLTWNFLQGCSLDYFMGKCQASETGRKFEQWSEEEAQRRGFERLKDHQQEAEGKEKLNREQQARVRKAIIEHSSTYQDWSQWVYDGDYSFALDDGDHNTCSAGYVKHPRGIGMWFGIQMAMEQLDQRSNNPTT